MRESLINQAMAEVFTTNWIEMTASSYQNPAISIEVHYFRALFNRKTPTASAKPAETPTHSLTAAAIEQ